MSDFLQNIDASVFHFINRSLQNPFLDILMPAITDLNRDRIVLLIVAVLLVFLFTKGGIKGRFAVLALAVGILFSDQLSSSVVKFILARPRPCHALQNVHLLVGCGSGYSFPSSHAVNTFCGAIILSFFYPRAARWLVSFAVIVCFSRVYVGVHYPSDVVGGAVIGSICGLVIIALFLQTERVVVNLVGKRRRHVPGHP